MTRRLGLAIATARDGGLISDITTIARNVKIEDGPHGPGQASCFIPGSLIASFRLYNRSSLPWLRLSDGARVIWTGRIEQIAVVPGGVEVHAFGAARGLSDTPYTAMWSVTSLETFKAEWLISTTGGPTTNRFFTIDAKNGVITIGLVKNTIMALNTRAHMYYRIPDGSSRQMVRLVCEWEFKASANVTMRISRWGSAYPFGGFTANDISVVGNGAVQTGVVFVGSATDIFSLGLEVTTAHTYAGETGAEYVKFSHVRLVSDVSRFISTTLTVLRTNGTGVTCTVGSTANMYVGQRILIGVSGGAGGEGTTILSIPSSTTFTADIVNAGAGYAIGTGVSAPLIYADTIISDIVTTADTLRSAAQAFTFTTLRRILSANTTRIENPGRDLLDETYEDADRAAILDYLTALGDTNTPPRTWRWFVDDQQRLVFAATNLVGGWPLRTWAIDIEDLTLERDLDGLANNVYATYQDTEGRTLRTAAAQDMSSISTYGAVRQAFQAASTTLGVQATLQRDTLLADKKTLRPRAAFGITQLYATNGARVALWELKTGDTLLVRNLPPGLSTDIDKIRRFRVTRVTLDIDARKIVVEPESPMPALEAMLARIPTGG